MGDRWGNGRCRLFMRSMLCVLWGLVLFLGLASAPAKAATFSFVSGNGSETISSASTATWTESGETLRFSVSGVSDYYPHGCVGLLGVEGDAACFATGEWVLLDTSTGSKSFSVTVSITNKLFDLSSLVITAWSGTGSYAITTSKGGSKSGSMNAAMTPTPLSFSGAQFDGISSFTIQFTGSGVSNTSLGLRDLVLNNITGVAAPSVTGIAPTSGPAAGGTSVVITGADFGAVQGASGVKFGSNNATSYTVNSATQITAIAPAGAQGIVDVTVTTAGGTSATGAGARFSYAAAPTATTGVASSIGAAGATIAGTANDNGADTTVSFEYGLNTAYGSTATATPATLSAGAGSTAVSGSLTGLACNSTYHFRLKAVNGIATTNGLDASFTTAACSVPGAPTIGTATAGDAQASVPFTPPASDGGAAITGYTATSGPDGKTGTCASSPCAVTGLTNGTAYTFTVTATNAVGTGAASAASNSVTPKAPQTITFANPGAQTFGTSPTLSASAPGGAVTFTSSSTGVCTVTSGGVLTFVTAGSCSINADQAGNAAYDAAATVQQTFTVTAVVPGAPIIGTAIAGDTQASVSFTAPTNTGGTTITGYTVKVSPPDVGDVNGAGNPIVVSGLTNGQAYTFTVTATNSAGEGPASAASNSVTPAASQTITFANPGAQNFGTTPTLTATSDSGLSVSFTSSTTGVCTITTGGALTFVTAGTCTINADQAGNATYLPATQVSRSFTVNPVLPGAPTAVSVTAGNTQATVSFSAPASNGGSAITGYTVTSSPGGLTGTGASSPIMVTGLTNGVTYTFTVIATNAAGNSAASAASNGVTPTDAPPVAGAVSATVAYGSSGNAVTLALSGGAATSVAAASAPAHGTATASGTSISYTPTAGFSGSDSFTYTATNAAGTSAPATVTITVNPQAPVANPVSATVAYGSSGSAITLNLGGGAASSVAVAGAPSHGTATASGTSISYTPVAGYSGSDSFTYTATNAGGTSAPATVTITVSPELPIAGAVTTTVAFGSSNNAIALNLSGGVATSVTVASAPAHGTATASGTGIAYTPTAGFSGSDTFTYTAVGTGGTSAPATVTITVNPQAPVVGNVSLTVEVNSTNNVVPLALSGGAAASVAVVTAPTHGVATVSGTSITYTPTSGFYGADSFTYSATNVTGTSAPGTVTLLVQSRPDPTKDAEVKGLINAQVAVANRFAQAQIGNFQSHLEGLHRHSHGGAAGGQSLANRRSPGDPWGEAASDDATATDPAANTRILAGRTVAGKRVVSVNPSGSDGVTSTAARPGNLLETSTGLDGFVLPQTKNKAQFALSKDEATRGWQKRALRQD